MLNVDSEERRSDAEESSRKRTNRQSIKDLGSRESLEFVYKKCEHDFSSFIGSTHLLETFSGRTSSNTAGLKEEVSFRV